MRRDAAMPAAMVPQARVAHVLAHIAVELTLDPQLVRGEIDGLEAGLGAQAAVAVSDLIGLARQCDPHPPAVARADQRRVGHCAASLRSTYCRMPPALKYSSSLYVSMRQRAVKANSSPLSRVTFTSTSCLG